MTGWGLYSQELTEEEEAPAAPPAPASTQTVGWGGGEDGEEHLARPQLMQFAAIGDHKQGRYLTQQLQLYLDAYLSK